MWTGVRWTGGQVVRWKDPNYCFRIIHRACAHCGSAQSCATGLAAPTSSCVSPTPYHHHPSYRSHPNLTPVPPSTPVQLSPKASSLCDDNPLNPAVYDRLSPLGSQILPPKTADITSPDLGPLESALEGASAVVSLAGVLVGSEKKMVEVQQEGAERVARTAKKVGAGRLVLVSAIGADKGGVTA
jgi:hypothetical protein